MSRVPIRVKLTIAFGLAMVLMLATAALFVYLRLRADLDDRIDASLDARLSGLVDPRREPGLSGVALEDPEETFVQLVSASGTLLATVGTLRGSALTPAEVLSASTGTVSLERELAGVDGRARVLARSAGDGTAAIVVVGQSLVDRNDALSNVVSSFAVGGAVATLLASLIGYLLAAAALAPVEAMRRRAQEVSLLAGDAGLPLPAARDEVRRLGETLNEMLTRLRAAFEREGRFVADASHELRTPIAIIKTELEGALQGADPETPLHASLVAASEECDRLAQLAEDLLVIARATDGELPIRPEPIDVGLLLTGVSDRFTDRAQRRGRVIRADDGHSLVVTVDPLRMRQALGNLVENALRHGSGAILLAVRTCPEGIEIDVSDEGAGFPPVLRELAFERFSQGDRARSSDGVGLGLAIVAAIAQAHCGRVSIVESELTTVRITLPHNLSRTPRLS